MGKWEMVRLGDVFLSIKNGVSIKQGKDAGAGYPITRIETISDGKCNRQKMGYAGLYDVRKYSDYIMESGDILMSHINSIKHLGKVARYEKLENEIIIHGMNLLKLKPNQSILNSQYAELYFNSHDFKRQIPNITKNSVNQSSFTVKALSELVIPLPPLPIQRKIADVLDRASALIEKRKAQIDKLDLLIKSQFIEMFGDPVTNPKRWETRSLSNVGLLGRGVSKHRPRNDPHLLNGKYPLIQTGDVANSNIYIKSFSSSYSEIGLKQSKMWKQGTLCITIAANIAKTGVLSFDACFPDSVVGFVPTAETDVLFIHFWFAFFQKILEEQAPESAQKNINLRILNELEIISPPILLQEQFADYVHQIEAIKTKLDNSLNSLALNYKSIIQQYFK